MLSEAIDELKQSPPASERPLGFFKDVRYAVFNYIPWKHFDSRTTVTYFNLVPTIIRDESDRNNRLVDVFDAAGDSAEMIGDHTVIIDGEVDGIEPALLDRAWRSRWSEYLSPSVDILQENRRPSWNEFLLSYSESPSNMGCVWHAPDVDVGHISGEYAIAYLPREIERHSVVEQSLRSFCRDSEALVDSDSIDYVRALRRECVPNKDLDDSQWGSELAISDAILSLYWGFGIWGADSFISIPVTYSSSSKGRTGVLSLGSINPLKPDEIAEWTLIAHCILGTILDLEAEDRIVFSTTNYTYRVGHPFKNRSHSVASFARNLITEFFDILDDIEDLEGIAMPEVIREALGRHKDDLLTLEQSSERLVGFGSLVNFLSALSIERNLWSTKRERRWLTSSPVPLRGLFSELEPACFHRDDPTLRLKIHYSPRVGDLAFACNVNNGRANLFLGDELLTDIFYELLINAIQHGEIIDGAVRLDVDITGHGEAKRITLTNIVHHELPQKPSRVAEYDIDGSGGETLAGHMLAALVSGSPRLSKQVFWNDEHFYHQYIVELTMKEWGV